MFIDILKVVLGLGMLVGGSELLVRGAAALARNLGISAMVVGLTVVAFGTSSPELVVGISAVLRGNAEICTGNVVGSNILNILLVLGITALIRPLRAGAAFVRREIPVMVGVSVLFAILAWTGDGLSQVESAVLVALLAAYIAYTLHVARRESKNVAREFEDMPAVQARPTWADLVLIAVGLGILLLGSDVLLDSAVSIARRFNVGDAIIGLTLVAVGTSFPELAASIVAARRGHPDICLGNIIGSSIYNLLAIAGAAGLVAPLPFQGDMASLHLPVMVASAIILWPLVLAGHRLGRRDGLLLLACYAVYLGWTLHTAMPA